MTSPPRRVLFLLGLAGLAWPAASEPRSAAAPVRDAAILPGAGLVAYVDVAALRASALAAGAPSFPGNEALARLSSAVGLGPADVLDVLVSARTEDIALERTAEGNRLSRAPGVVAISLAKPLGPDELRSGLEAMWDDLRPVSASGPAELGIFEVGAAAPQELPFYAATSTSGTVVFLASDLETLEGTLERERSGRTIALAAPLAAAERSLPSARQAYLVLAPPPIVRERLQGSESEGARAPTMVERVLEPFRDLATLALSATLTDEVRLELVGDLADASAARRAEELLESFILPSLRHAMSARFGENLVAEDGVSVESDGSTARVRIRLEPDRFGALGLAPPSK